jgi:hypothetical protein
LKNCEEFPHRNALAYGRRSPVSRRCAEVKFPGYIKIKDHDHIYSPGGGCWHHQHDKAKIWTRLDVREECRDAEQVANSIIAHLSATKKSV